MRLARIRSGVWQIGLGALTALWAYLSGQPGVVIFVLGLVAAAAVAILCGRVTAHGFLARVFPIATGKAEDKAFSDNSTQRLEERVSEIAATAKLESGHIHHLVTMMQKMLCRRIAEKYSQELTRIDLSGPLSNLEAMKEDTYKSDDLIRGLASLLRETRWHQNFGAISREAEHLADRSIEDLHSRSEMPKVNPVDLRRHLIAKHRNETVAKFLILVQKEYDAEFEADMRYKLDVLGQYNKN
jgi:hypothetical protein